MRFFNTLTRSIETFEPLIAGEVSLYTCGPTVHNFAHIGNFRAFLFFDLLKRALRFQGYKVKHVMNITDVDDKTIRAAKAVGKSLKEYTTHYTAEFLNDMRTLGAEVPDALPRATDEIEPMVEMIERLLKSGHAYKNERGDIYFRISAFPEYGELSRLDKQQLRQNADGRLARSDEYEKDDARDFALWKAWDADDGDVFWETRIGKGRPGWHIECSAMAAKYLGQPFDIHGGGIDLMFPHHENEIAQSRCSCGKPLARFWMHNAHLLVDGRKMAKSLKNFFTVRDLLEKGCDPIVLRLELLKTHYRQTLDFRADGMEASTATVKRMREFHSRLEEAGKGPGAATLNAHIEKALREFGEALDDDLNVAQAFAAIFEFVGETGKVLAQLSAAQVAEVRKTMESFNAVFGVFGPGQIEVPVQVKDLAVAREQARKSKDFARADEIRKQIAALGFDVKDSPLGSKIIPL